MKQARGFILGLLFACSAAPGWSANHVTVESKSVAPGATGVQIGVFISNDVPITAMVLPLELRSATPGTYLTTSFTFVRQVGRRVHNSPLGPAYDNGVDSVWPSAQITHQRYAVTGAPPCSGPISSTYANAAAAIDFISPDAVMHATVSTGNTGAGELISLAPGSDPAGTTNASFLFTFNVNSVDGLIEIDTCCVRPANHLTYVDEFTLPIYPTFTIGVVTVGNPVFPPVVTDIPNQTIDEGQSFAAINLDDYVSDLDDPDASLMWTTSGQSQLIVSISPGRVATISTPNPDWFGSETIVFRATDNDANFDEDTATFTVNPVNDPPVLANITNKSRLAGLPLTFGVTGSDIDNPCGNLVFSMLNAPAGANLTNDGNCGAAFNWSTVCLDSGVYQVTFVVTDGALADSQVVQITILYNPDRFNVDPDSLAFTFAVGQSEPPAQDLDVGDPGCGEMNFEAIPDAPWLLVTPPTAMTPATLSVDVDTAGLAAGDYTAMITIRQTGVVPPESILVPVKLKVTQELCICNCHGDPPPSCDGIHNVQNVVIIIAVAFRGALELAEATCPVSMTDVNCDNQVDVLDVVYAIEFVWRNGPPYCNPCVALAAGTASSSN